MVDTAAESGMCYSIIYCYGLPTCNFATPEQCPVCKMDVTLPRIHSPPPTSRMPSFALPVLTSPSNWRTALTRRLDDLREWVRVLSPAQQQSEVGA